jgi:hypothetical protein
MSIIRFVAVCATSSLTMFNVFLFVMLVWSAQLTEAQDGSQVDGISASAAVIANDANRVRKLNGVTQRDGVSGATGGGTPPVLKPPSLSDRTGKSSNTGLVDDEGYWREVKAIIGGVLGFWGGVGGLGTMFLVIVLSQRYCCKKDDGKHDDGDG